MVICIRWEKVTVGFNKERMLGNTCYAIFVIFKLLRIDCKNVRHSQEQMTPKNFISVLLRNTRMLLHARR